MSINDILNPLLPSIGTLLGGALAAAGVRFLNHGAASIKDSRIRATVTTLINAAESKATSPTTGPDKKAWVMARAQNLFPSVPPAVLDNTIEGIFTGLQQAAPVAPTVLAVMPDAQLPPPAQMLTDLSSKARLP